MISKFNLFTKRPDIIGDTITESDLDHALLTNLNSTNYTHLTAANHTDLTDGGDSALHFHATDRARANHTGTQTAATISDFDTEVSNNVDVAANTAARHSAVTVVDGTTINFTLTGQQITAEVITSAVDHGGLAGLSDDDHSQYALLLGRSGGQSLIGGTGANDDLTLEGTTHATRTSSYVILQPSGGDVGIGVSTPTDKLDVAGAIRVTSDIAFDAAKGGRIYKGATNGLVLHGVTGTSYDLGFYGAAGGGLFVNPTGTTDAVFNPSAGRAGFGIGVPTAQLHISQLSGNTTGNTLRVTRNLTATSTDSPVVDIVQDHTGDDQTVFRLQSDGTGDIVNVFDGASEVFTILDGGNVGVNNTAPEQPIHATGGGANKGGFRIDNTGGGAALIAQRTDGSAILLQGGQSTASLAFTDNGYFQIMAYQDASRTQLLTGTFVGGQYTTALVVDSTAQVGFGTATTLVGDVDVNNIAGGVLTLRRNDTSVVGGDTIGKIQFYAMDTSSVTNKIAAEIAVESANSTGVGITTDINPGRIIFKTTPSTVGAASPLESFRIIGNQDIVLADVTNIQTNATTGSQIATATTQKIAFYGATPIVRPGAYTQTYATANKTIAAISIQTLTAASGTGDTTVADVGAAFNQTTLNNNFKDLANQINNASADITDLKQAVNAIIDDLQALGLVG